MADVPPRQPVPASQLQFLAASAVLFLVLFGNNAPTPLYPIWQQEFGLSTTATTAIHSAYPFGTIVGLLFGGKIADQIGRRPIIFIACLSGMAAAAIPLGFDTLFPLLLARFLNGIATGLASGPVVAVMVEAEPSGDHARASWGGALITMLAASCGMFLATMIVRYAPSVELALTIPFLFQFLFYVGSLALVLYLHETLKPEWRKSWRNADLTPRAVGIPPEIRRDFGIAALVAFTTWSLVGFWLGMGPTIVAARIGTGELVHGGIAASIMLALAGITQLAFYRIPDRRSLMVGISLVALAIVAVGLFMLQPHLPLLYLAAVLTGVAHGLAWQGSARLVNRISPVDQRAETVSTLYIVVYGGVMFIFGVGLMADIVGIVNAVLGLMVLLGLLSAATLLSARRLPA